MSKEVKEVRGAQVAKAIAQLLFTLVLLGTIFLVCLGDKIMAPEMITEMVNGTPWFVFHCATFFVPFLIVVFAQNVSYLCLVAFCAIMTLASGFTCIRSNTNRRIHGAFLVFCYAALTVVTLLKWFALSAI